MKRIALFLATNLMVMAMVAIVFSVFGLDGVFSQRGLNLTSLLVLSLVIGFGGSIVSLLMSRTMAKWMMKIELVTPQSGGGYGQIANDVYALARAANLKAMPEVGIYDSPEMNAFATGPSQSKSLVAVSTGLLAQMPRDQVQAVIAHEISHIKNGDMVTMTLIQGVVNTFAVFLARIVAYIASNFVDSRLAGLVYFLVSIVCQILFTILGSLITFAFSRAREYRADAGAAELVGKAGMIGALQTLQHGFEPLDAPNGLQTAKIADGKSRFSLFDSHPPLEKRIAALQQRA